MQCASAICRTLREDFTSVEYDTVLSGNDADLTRMSKSLCFMHKNSINLASFYDDDGNDGDGGDYDGDVGDDCDGDDDGYGGDDGGDGDNGGDDGDLHPREFD